MVLKFLQSKAKSAVLLLFLSCLIVLGSLAAEARQRKKTVIADPDTRLEDKVSPAFAPSAATSPQSITDPTTQVQFAPGLEVIFHIYEGLDNQWRHVGDYDFTARVEETSGAGYIYEWRMGEPVRGSGSRRTESNDVKHSRKVSLFYPKHENCTLVDFTNALRISDDLYRDLKAGKKSDFTIDGPETVMILHAEAVPLPHTIKGEGLETIQMNIEGKVCPVRCIKAVCDNGWTYWILDNPRFPLMVQGNAPFRWVTALNHAYGNGDADKEARNIFDQLKDGGIATSYLILFDFDKDTLRPLSKEILQSLSKYLKQDPTLKLQIEGHTCTIGGYDYNMGLSGRRARSVKRYLVDVCNIEDYRLKPVGFGYTRPDKPNDTEYGRSRNRRVVFRKIK